MSRTKARWVRPAGAGCGLALAGRNLSLQNISTKGVGIIRGRTYNTRRSFTRNLYSWEYSCVLPRSHSPGPDPSWAPTLMPTWAFSSLEIRT